MSVRIRVSIDPLSDPTWRPPCNTGLAATDDTQSGGTCELRCLRDVAAERDLGKRLFGLWMDFLVGNDSESVSVTDSGVVVATNVHGFAGNLMKFLNDTPAMTLSSGLVVSRNPSVESGQLNHEFGHIAQAQDLGLLYTPAYIGGVIDEPFTMLGSQVAGRLTGSRVLSATDWNDWHDANPMEWNADMRKPRNPTNIYARK